MIKTLKKINKLISKNNFNTEKVIQLLEKVTFSEIENKDQETALKDTLNRCKLSEDEELKQEAKEVENIFFKLRKNKEFNRLIEEISKL